MEALTPDTYGELVELVSTLNSDAVRFIFIPIVFLTVDLVSIRTVPTVLRYTNLQTANDHLFTVDLIIAAMHFAA